MPGAGHKCPASKEPEAGQVAGRQTQRDLQDGARGRRQEAGLGAGGRRQAGATACPPFHRVLLRKRGHCVGQPSSSSGPGVK